MNETLPAQPVPTRVKLVFWILLGGLSAVMAEVIAGSSPYPFFTFWGIVAVVPLYGLHVLVLNTFAFRAGRVTLPILFIAGAILGMYEAYLTKVLWSPTWGDFNFELGGIYVIQTVVLVLFWHPFMAYILPVFLAENLCTDSSETFAALPPKMRAMLSDKSKWTWTIIVFAIYFAIYKSFGTPDWVTAFVSGLSNIAVLFGLGVLWRHVKGERKLTFRDVQPSKKEAVVLGLLLLLAYVVQGLLLRPEALPHTLGPHLTVWIIYAVLFTLLYFNVKRASGITDEPQPAPFKGLAVRTAFLFALIVPLLSVILLQIKIVSIILVLLSWLAGCLLGAIILIRSGRALYIK